MVLGPGDVGDALRCASATAAAVLAEDDFVDVRGAFIDFVTAADVARPGAGVP